MINVLLSKSAFIENPHIHLIGDLQGFHWRPQAFYVGHRQQYNGQDFCPEL